jgi:two-component system KDP operon response regulator KdpE
MATMVSATAVNPLLGASGDHAKVLAVDDDEATLTLLTLMLQSTGAQVFTATSGPQALRLAFDRHPDVVLLDLLMPEMDGLSVCQRLRDLSDMPIIMVTALNDSARVTSAFALGADDYIIKPFETPEFLARIQACLRRGPKSATCDDCLVLGQGELIIDIRRHSVWARQREIHLTRTEFDLLVCMARNRGRVLSHAMLMETIYSTDCADGRDSLKQFICALRRKIESDPRHPQWLVNEHGIGYMLTLD